MVMRNYFYTFQFSRITVVTPRSKRNDVNLITFGVLLNRREQGRGLTMTPMWKGTTLRGEEMRDTRQAFSSVNMKKDWTIGPTEVRPDDTVQVVWSATNTADDNLVSFTQEDVDKMAIGAFNILYSFLLGKFVSAFGLKVLSEFVGAAPIRAVAAVLSDPVGTLLGYEVEGPCNGLVFADEIAFTARELDSLPFERQADSSYGRPLIGRGDAETAVITRTYTIDQDHNKERCGEPPRTEVELTVRRYDEWSLKRAYWDRGAQSMRRWHPRGGSLKELARLRA